MWALDTLPMCQLACQKQNPNILFRLQNNQVLQSGLRLHLDAPRVAFSVAGLQYQ